MAYRYRYTLPDVTDGIELTSREDEDWGLVTEDPPAATEDWGSVTERPANTFEYWGTVDG